MKNKFQFLFILLTIIIVLFPSICFSEQPNPKIWKYLGYNSYYNIKIITTSSNTLLVWIYNTVSDDTREKRIQEVKTYNLEKSIKYQQYHHDVVLWEIDCKKRLWTLKDIIEFDNNEKVLDRYRYNNSEWNSIIPNSKGERLYNKVCVHQKEPLKKKK